MKHALMSRGVLGCGLRSEGDEAWWPRQRLSDRGFLDPGRGVVLDSFHFSG